MKKSIFILLSLISVCSLSAMDKSTKFIGAGRVIKDGTLIGLGTLVTYYCFKQVKASFLLTCVAGKMARESFLNKEEDRYAMGVFATAWGFITAGCLSLGSGVGYLTAKRALNLLEDIKK